MKIKITEIEANAEELKNCNTLSQNLNMMLSRAFAPKYDYQSEESEDEE
ncbi:MAG: hypothetical protein IKO36_10175 [Bacteroidaceae bacterium]|nr:hypothetical protein [Bacteroidaceae bacterium]